MIQTKKSSLFVALLTGGPFALWLSAGLSRPLNAAPQPVPPVAVPAPSASSSINPVSDFPGVPSDYCVARFDSAIQAMAGSLPVKLVEPAPASSSSASVAPRNAPARQAAAPSAPQPPRAEPAPAKRAEWLDQVETAVKELKNAFRASAAASASAPTASSLIVTIPDPIDSGLSYSFETMLQAVRQGVENGAGEPYYRDRSWLPWLDRDVEAVRQKESEQCRASTPGLILFRGGDPDQAKLFALLLVGESPTTGLRQATMLNALRIKRLFDGDDKPAVHEVAIVGPSFSGSAQSLRLSLQNWALQNPTETIAFKVITGTATGSQVPDWLGGRKHDQLTSNSTVSFQTTTVPEALVECGYLRFLNRQLGVEPEEHVADAGKPIPLAGVATLSESGTEFGATSSGGSESSEADKTRPCPWRASSTIHFPFHVSALRDAYEDLDHKDLQARKDTTIARAVSLGASLREARAPLDVESAPGQKTRSADDITLGSVLSHISTRHIRHLAIHATDIGDAIFLARRIRDVAPDVRLAFFDSDALILHPDFRRELVGSLVVTPYPFLGLSDFSSASGKKATLGGFENGSAQGIYNAVLAQRGAGIPDADNAPSLSDYAIASNTALPVWISTVGRGVVIPTKVSPTADCAGEIYGAARRDHSALGTALANVCSPADPDPEKQSERWRIFKRLSSAPLTLAKEARLPYEWDFLFALLCFAFGVDQARRNKAERRFAKDDFPKTFAQATEHALDLAIARTKWRLYASIRSFLFALAFAYMGILYALAVKARGGPHLYWEGWHNVLTAAAIDVPFVVLVSVAGAAIFLSVKFTATMTWRFCSELGKFATCVGSSVWLWRFKDILESVAVSTSAGPDYQLSSMPPTLGADTTGTVSIPPPALAVKPNASVSTVPFSRRIADRVTLTFGITDPRGRLQTARVSFAQLRLLAWLSGLAAFIFVGLLALDTVSSADLPDSWLNNGSASLTLLVLRSASLTSGISPSMPALMCVLCTYVWAVGRMARLSLAHSTSRISPPDHETDLVSTPIRLILHPGYGTTSGSKDADAGFTAVERSVVNSIWRPITGPYYVAAAVTVAFFPIVLFTLKPLSTLTGTWGTLFLGAGLALSVFLIGITLVQMVQYWLSLKQLLKRIMEHPIGAAFQSVPAFARDSVDHQISRTPDEALRWSACAQQFCELVRLSGATPDDFGTTGSLLTERAQHLEDARRAALAGRGARCKEETHPDTARAEAESNLARQVIDAASEITRVLETPWQATARHKLRIPEVKSAALPFEPEIVWRQASGDSMGPPRTQRPAELPPPPHGPRNLAPAPPTPASALAPTAPVTEPPSSGEELVAKRAKVAATGDHEPAARDALTPAEDAYDHDELKWLRAAQTFVATVVTLLVYRHVRQFRYFLHVTTACALLLVLAVTSYPFEPYRLLLTFIWVVMASVVSTCLWIFLQLDRNTLMSHLSGTTPQTVTLDGAFALRLVGWTIVPLLSVAAAQYPEVANLLYALVGPFANSLR